MTELKFTPGATRCAALAVVVAVAAAALVMLQITQGASVFGFKVTKKWTNLTGLYLVFLVAFS